MKEKDFTHDDIRKIARLSRLRLTEAEVARSTKELNDFGVWAATIPQEEEDKKAVLGVQNNGQTLHLRKDQVQRDTQLKDLLNSAEASEGNFLVVPHVHGDVK